MRNKLIKNLYLLGNTPRVIMGTHRPRHPKSEIGPGSKWWSIQFDRVVRIDLIFVCKHNNSKRNIDCMPQKQDASFLLLLFFSILISRQVSFL